jgi:hypothetical protein
MAHTYPLFLVKTMSQKKNGRLFSNLGTCLYSERIPSSDHLKLTGQAED